MSCEICRHTGHSDCPVCRKEYEEEEEKESIWEYFNDGEIVTESDNWTVREDQFGNLEYK